MVRRRVGQHPHAADREHRCAGLVAAGQHRVGQAAAQRRHVDLGLDLAAVEDHQVRHGLQPGRDGGVAVGARGHGLRHRRAVLRRERKHRVQLAGAAGAEIRRHDLGAAVVGAPAQQSQQHRGVVHEAFAMALGGVLGQHLAEGLPLAGLPHADHLPVQLLEERAPDAEAEFGRQPVLREAVAQGPAGQEGHGAVVALFHGPAHGPSPGGRCRPG